MTEATLSSVAKHSLIHCRLFIHLEPLRALWRRFSPPVSIHGCLTRGCLGNQVSRSSTGGRWSRSTWSPTPSRSSTHQWRPGHMFTTNGSSSMRMGGWGGRAWTTIITGSGGTSRRFLYHCLLTIQMFLWMFHQKGVCPVQAGTTYTMFVRAVNLVSDEEINTTVHVVGPITGLRVSPSRSPSPVHLPLTVWFQRSLPYFYFCTSKVVIKGIVDWIKGIVDWTFFTQQCNFPIAPIPTKYLSEKFTYTLPHIFGTHQPGFLSI